MRNYQKVIFGSKDVKRTHQDEELRKEKELLNDIMYIRRDIIAQQPNGAYCRYSKILKAASSYNVRKEEYTRYWRNNYAKDPARLEQILAEIEVKLTTGLIPLEEMIELIKNSKEQPKEKNKILDFLTNPAAGLNPDYKVKGASWNKKTEKEDLEDEDDEDYDGEELED